MGQRIAYLVGGTLLTLLLQLAAGLFGAAGFLFSLAVPVPAAFAGMRQGASVAGGIVLLTAAALTLGGNWLGSLAYLLQFGAASWLLPLLLRRGWNWDRTVAVLTLTLAAASFLALAGYASWQERPVGTLVETYLQEESGKAVAIYSDAGIDGQQLEELQNWTRQMADFLVLAWPGLLVISIGSLLLLLLLLLWVLSRDRYPWPGSAYRSWKAPEHLIWVLIAGGVGLLLGSGLPQRVAVNLLVMLLPIYFLQGLAIVQYFFWKKNTAPLFRHLGYFIIAVFNPLPLIVTGMGIFDMWIDFRKPRIKKT